MIKYIGSKRALVGHISELVGALPSVHRVLDAFSGTARVGHALKARGLHVTANDHNAYAFHLGRCYVQADENRWLSDAARLVAELNALPGSPGYFTQTFCEQSRYVHPKNGERIDAIRDAIAAKSLPPELESVMLVSLMEAADRVDSTCGLQMAYLKQWAARANNDLQLRVPHMLPGPGAATQLDALDACTQAEFDVVYLDPPYNQHKYRNNYHVWETLVRWDKPEVYGIAQKRVDCREYDSAFNSKKRIHEALQTIIQQVRTRYLIVSFSNEGYLSENDLVAMLALRCGPVRVFSVDFKRYVGAQIGIYNPQGVKTGKVSHLRNRELMFVAACDDAELPVLPTDFAEQRTLAL
jgi:adenine-specific DNA-methyltransferase